MYTYGVCEFESWVPGSQVIGSTECSVPLSRACSYSVRATNMSLPAFIIGLDLPGIAVLSDNMFVGKNTSSYFLLSNIHEMMYSGN